MKLVFTPRADADLANQFDYGARRFGERVARRTMDHDKIDAFESWVHRTPFVIFYRLDEANGLLIVLAVYHHAQDRSDFVPET